MLKLSLLKLPTQFKTPFFNQLFNKKLFPSLLIILFGLSLALFSGGHSFAKDNDSNGSSASTDSTAAAGSKRIKIGILLPIEHAALREIVDGFKKIVSDRFPGRVDFEVQIAQGDIKLQRNIIDLFIGQKMDMIVPIGTGATQMTISLVKQQPIVSLAAQITEAERQKFSSRNMTGVLDEIGGKKKIEFIKAIMPDTKVITVIYHAANEKNFKEVEEVVNTGKSLGIKVNSIVIQNLPDLETAGKAVSDDSEAILILKDHVVASGVRLLLPIAQRKNIPLITSDEGTVQEGATFGLGVKERAIGEEGGVLAIKVLEGKPIADLPIEEMQNLTVFYHPDAMKQSTSFKIPVTIEQLKNYAKKKHYSISAVGL